MRYTYVRTTLVLAFFIKINFKNFDTYQNNFFIDLGRYSKEAVI